MPLKNLKGQPQIADIRVAAALGSFLFRWVLGGALITFVGGGFLWRFSSFRVGVFLVGTFSLTFSDYLVFLQFFLISSCLPSPAQCRCWSGKSGLTCDMIFFPSFGPGWGCFLAYFI